ncbi:MAG: hypothetical protein FJX77_01540, partial [Armatimonadetes bacterium]|nr:hypothetical protein [Armatimonadota bacterium]
MTLEQTPLATPPVHQPGELRKFPCKQCGAGLEFRPGQEALQCPYCGHREVIPRSESAIREYDLEMALRSLPRTEGWGTERRAFHCENCGATTTLQPGQTAGECAFCGSSRVVEKASSTNLVRPESLLPFVIPRDQAVAKFREWIRGGWF